MVISTMEEAMQRRGVTGLQVVPSSQQITASLMAGFWSPLYLGAPRELSEKQLLCGYLAMSCFFFQPAVLLDREEML